MIGFIGTYLQLQSIITAHKQWLPKTRSFLATFSSDLSSTANDFSCMTEFVLIWTAAYIDSRILGSVFECSFIRKHVLYRGGPQESTSMETCFERSFILEDRLCGLVVTDPEVPGSIPGATRFSESSGSGTGSTQPREDNWGATWKKRSGCGLETWN
jgi:hypothetical protein